MIFTLTIKTDSNCLNFFEEFSAKIALIKLESNPPDNEHEIGTSLCDQFLIEFFKQFFPTSIIS